MTRPAYDLHVFASPEVLTVASTAWDEATRRGCDTKQAVALVADALWNTAVELAQAAALKALDASLASTYETGIAEGRRLAALERGAS